VDRKVDGAMLVPAMNPTDLDGNGTDMAPTEQQAPSAPFATRHRR
jgi:hypothetical protein